MVCHINCSGIAHAKQLHELLARYLELPSWYGHNLDALHDCLTEQSGDLLLYFSCWDSATPWAPGFEAVLADARQECPELTVIFE